MVITAIAWADVGQTRIKVTTSDEGVKEFTHYPTYNSNETWHHGVIRQWLAIEGNTITAFVDGTDYMKLLRGVRDQKITEIYWRIERNYTQVAHSETPTDDGTKMAELYTYLKDLRDFPANNPVTTKAEYDALVWPTKPA